MKSLQQPRRYAFNLIELMVVIAMIATLIALLMVGAQRLRDAGNRTRCANNMRQLGFAYLHFVDKNHSEASSFKGDSTWIKNLAPYLENREDVFFCPSALQRASVEYDDVPKAFIRVKERSGATFLIPFAKENSLRMRVSNKFPSTVPGSYVVEIEDYTDTDWNDLVMLIEPSADGASFVITAKAKESGYSYDLLGPDQNLLVSGFQPGSSSTAIVPGNAARSNYAITSQAAFLSAGDADKVLAVEYNKIVANVFGSSAPDFWPATAAPRHRGVLNILFRNGAVQSFSAVEIDPRNDGVYKRSWEPTVPGLF